MKSSLYVLIGHIICIIKFVTTITDADKKQEIQELERQKDEIYVQINVAIDDTIQILEKNNDSYSREGIAYLQELKLQIADYNSTDFADYEGENNSSAYMNDLNQTSDLKTDNSSIVFNNRRRGYSNKQRNGFEKVKKAIVSMSDFKVFDPNAESEKKQERIANALMLQKQLDVWMEKRNAEQRVIAQYKSRLPIAIRNLIRENCPDYGVVEKISEWHNTTTKWPCCRKCCKNSYLGCLK